MQEQLNDTDRLGDACDPDTDPLGASGLTSTQSPRMFDPFVGAPGSWAYLPAPTSEGVAHLPALEYAEPSARLFDQFLIETTVRFPTPAVDATFEILAQGSAFCPQFLPCNASLTCTLMGDGHLVLGSFDNVLTSSEVLDVSAPILLWVRSSLSTQSPGGGLSQHCVGVDVHGFVVSVRQDEVAIPSGGLRYVTRFSAGPQPVDLHYVWLVSN
jgi:hypothetical protein